MNILRLGWIDNLGHCIRSVRQRLPWCWEAAGLARHWE